MQTVKIFISEPDRFTQVTINYLKTYAQVDFGTGAREELKYAFANYDVVWIRLANKIDKSLFSEGMRCKILANPVTGIDHINQQDCKEADVSIVCLKGEKEFLKEVRATAELTVGILLSLIRNIPEASQSVKEGVWNRDLFPGVELFKKTLGIAGMGRLGKIVAEYGQAFGMDVVGYDKDAEFPEGVRRVNTLEELSTVSDFLSIHLTYDETTENLFGKSCFDAMKSTAFLVNTSRGGIVDDTALLKALETKGIAGAALDVLKGEPDIDKSNPLVDYANKNNNLLIVPHIGGNTPESFEKTELFIGKKVNRTLKAIGYELEG